jgi:hypothetical protein
VRTLLAHLQQMRLQDQLQRVHSRSASEVIDDGLDHVLDRLLFQLQSGECGSTCAAGYYSDKGVCSRCYMSCKTCSGPGHNQCVNCPEGWQLLSGECRPDCPEGYYKTEYGCQKCHYSCRNCIGSLNKKRSGMR